jgi:hypothetical protein
MNSKQEFHITQQMKVKTFINFHNHYSRNLAEGELCFDLFEQKYGRSPNAVEIWDWDEDILKTAEQFVNELWKQYIKEVK